ncbi:hypothetical protein GGI11_006271, partial [Coemansia sp. RSA 2049]
VAVAESMIVIMARIATVVVAVLRKGCSKDDVIRIGARQQTSLQRQAHHIGEEDAVAARAPPVKGVAAPGTPIQVSAKETSCGASVGSSTSAICGSAEWGATQRPSICARQRRGTYPRRLRWALLSRLGRRRACMTRGCSTSQALRIWRCRTMRPTTCTISRCLTLPEGRRTTGPASMLRRRAPRRSSVSWAAIGLETRWAGPRIRVWLAIRRKSSSSAMVPSSLKRAMCLGLASLLTAPKSGQS